MDRLYPITIVDNFFNDPDKVREFALKQTFKTNKERVDSGENTLYPGLRTDGLHLIDIDLYFEVTSKLFSIYHNIQEQRVNWEVFAYFQLVPKDWNDGWIHIDGSDLSAGVIYLTPNAPLNSGTSIYKPNSLFDANRYEELQLSKNLFFRQNIKSNKYDQEKLECNSMFDETIKVNNLYNRFVMFNGNEYHGADTFFGSDEEDSRLTLVYFMHKLETDRPENFPLYRMDKVHRIDNKDNIK
jgi:hypothetical protein